MSQPYLLIIEDDPHQAMLFADELRDEGYEVALARSGAEAWEMIHTRRPDLIVLDIMLPRMDGLELIRRFAEWDPDLPVILHTCYPSYQQDLRSAWARAYVVKNTDLTNLKEAIAAAIREHRAGVVSPPSWGEIDLSEWERRLLRLLEEEGGDLPVTRVAERFRLCLHQVQGWLDWLVAAGRLEYRAAPDGRRVGLPPASQRTAPAARA